MEIVFANEFSFSMCINFHSLLCFGGCAVSLDVCSVWCELTVTGRLLGEVCVDVYGGVKQTLQIILNCYPNVADIEQIGGYQVKRNMCRNEINLIVSYLREFSPYEAQVLLAQQIGSTLGAGRDSVDNSCSADKFIMSPLFSQTPRTQWSTCSLAEVQRWLETEYGIQGSACLDNAPTRIQEVVLHPSSVNVFSGSRQGTVQRLTEEDGKCLVLLEGQGEEGGQDSNPPVNLSNINWVLPEDIHLDEVTSTKLTISYINTGVDRWFFFLRDFAGARSIALGSTFQDPSREKGQVVTRTFQLGVDHPFADLVQADTRQVRLQVRTKRNRPTVDKRFLLDEVFLTIVHGPRTIMQ
ncbi:hypothetical protein QOT17_021543 [Balamuthia mandrillaris]